MVGLTPEAFSARLGCEPDLILAYERGATSVGAATLPKLTQVCQVEVGYFLAEMTGDHGPPRPVTRIR